MKKWIATIAIIILSWSGSITAVELSKEGCKELRNALLKRAINDGDEERVNELLKIELWESKLSEHEFLVFIIEVYCENIKTMMEPHEIKENSPEWHELLHLLSQ